MKFYGNIGFWIGDEETIPGITRPIIKEKKYFGDLQEYSRRWQSSDSINDELKINTKISILSDSFIQKHLTSIKYVTINGNRFKVASVSLDYPRLTLEVGGMYNGEIAPDST